MLDQLFYWGELPLNRIHGNYDYGLVALSFLIAALASYVALNMAAQLGREQSRRVALFWHVGGAIAMGAGIWSMHFTGMLAFNMGIVHNYNLNITLLSLLIPILFSYIVLYIVRTRQVETLTILQAAPFLGIGIAAMHYTGMAAMQMDAALRYRPGFFILSVLIAISASAAALALSLKAARHRPGSRIPFKMLSAAVMGAAICGMHYTAMHAAVILPSADCRFDPAFGGKNIMLAFGVGSVTLLILGIALAALTINQKFAEYLKEEVIKRTEELKRANEDLRYAKELAEAASIAKNEFLANMSHEIRTPMNAVVGIADLLQAGNLAPERKKQCLDTLQLSADALLKLINELLDISKIEANNIELEYIDFDLRTLVEEVIGLLSVRAQEKVISLSCNYIAGATRFRGDPLRIRQILVNLLSNAVKFTEQGTVNVRVESQILPHARLMDVGIIVADTGIGIPRESLQSIFQKFTQGEVSTTRKYGGSGLGLAICKGLVEKMGGSIDVESAIGEGSIFTVHLLLSPTPADEILAFSSEVKKPDNGIIWHGERKDRARILLVEDNAANTLVTTTYLQNLGLAYDVAHNGREALEKYAAGRYELILMDIQMPDMSGYEVAQWMRKSEGRNLQQATPIIAMTAFASVESRTKCMQAGMNDYIAKPFKSEELTNKIFSFVN